MKGLIRRIAASLLVLVTAGAAGVVLADESIASGDTLFSRNYEGRLDPILPDLRTIDAFKVRGYPIYFLEFHEKAAQSEALDRIGIFVESDRYSGKILAPTLMQTLEAEAFFDGHDYDSKDLARFFTLASRFAIRLHPMEIQVRQILVRLGVFAEEGGRYVARQNAALVAAVRGLDERYGPGTRRWLLDHEFRHGYYFVALRDEVHEIWEKMLDDDEREIIATTLRRTAYYNPDDDSLMEREFHAMVFEPRFEDDMQELWTRGLNGPDQPKLSDVEELIRKLPAIRRAFVEIERDLQPPPASSKRRGVIQD